MIAKDFPDYEDRIAVGLVGRGSECYGFDDDISRDHDFGVGFAMWLTDEDEAKIGFRLMRSYSKLKESLGVTSSSHSSVMGYFGDGVMRIGDFYGRYLPSGGVPKNNKEWLFTESEFFAEATNGEVFRDDLQIFTGIRNGVLNGMPEDVRIKKIAANSLRMAKSGQYNYARCLAHKEFGAAQVALTEFVTNAARTVFLLNRAYAPYYKWLFRAMDGLDKLSDLKDPLEYLLTSDNDSYGQSVKQGMIEDIAASLVKEVSLQFGCRFEDNYLEPVAFKLNSLIKDSELRDMHILLG